MIDDKTPSHEVSTDELIHQQEFGVRLREAREHRGLSIRDVAEQLNLNEDVLKAIESSSIEKLPAPTFTQGYIRSYARMLKLPADEILHAYNLAVPEKENPLVANYGMPIQTAEENSLIKPFVLLFILLLLGVLGYFALDSGLQRDVDSVDLATNHRTDAVVPEVIGENDSLVSLETNEISESEQEPAQSEVIQIVEEEIINSVEATPVSDSDRLESPVLDASPNQPQELQQQTVTAVEGSDVLEISTSSASWAEVQDVKGNRLIFELLDKERTYQVTGVAPFNIFLGNAPSIQLLVNNHEVDIASFVRKNNIAHITIEDNGIARFSQRDKMPVVSNDNDNQQDSSDAVD